MSVRVSVVYLMVWRISTNLQKGDAVLFKFYIKEASCIILIPTIIILKLNCTKTKKCARKQNKSADGQTGKTK